MMILGFALACVDPESLKAGSSAEHGDTGTVDNVETGDTDSGEDSEFHHTADAAQDVTVPIGPDPAGRPACDWSSHPEPHWSVALPWILASADSDGLVDHDVADQRISGVTGTYDAISGVFSIALMLEGAQFVTITESGVINTTSMSSVVTRTLVDALGNPMVENRLDVWTGCDLRRVGTVPVPFVEAVEEASVNVTFDPVGVATLVASTSYGDSWCGWTRLDGLSASRTLRPEGTIDERGTVEMTSGNTAENVTWTLVGGDTLAVVATIEEQFTDCRSSHLYGGRDSILTGSVASVGYSSWNGDVTWDATNSGFRYEGVLSFSASDEPTLGGQANWSVSLTTEHGSSTDYAADECSATWSDDPSTRVDVCETGDSITWDTLWFLDTPFNPWW